MTKLSTAFASIALLAFAFVMPACDIQQLPCDPYKQACVVDNNHPDTLAPKLVDIKEATKSECNTSCSK